jgi:hypothetical protein
MTRSILNIALIFFCLRLSAQSNGIPPDQFYKELSVLKYDLTIANPCDNPKRLIVPVDTLNMNFHSLELMNVELQVRKIINKGKIIYRCGSVVIVISQNANETSK